MKWWLTSLDLILYVTKNKNTSSEITLQHGLLTRNTLKI